MKSLVIVALLVAVTLAKPATNQVSVTQDTIGNYKVSVDVDGVSRIEKGNADGSVSGTYSFIDADGHVQTVQYTAGVDGFRATGNHLPVAPGPVQYTPEVAAARALHFAALNAASH